MGGAITARRSGARIAVLALLFAAGLLCALCSGPSAAAGTGGGAQGSVSESSAAVGPAPAGIAHTDDDRHGHDCQAAAGLGAGTEQRTAMVKLFALTALGAAAPVLLWSAAPALRVWIARGRRGPLRPGSRLLLSLCVQRV
ncbi:hypothetical protein ACFOVU_03985 [Nocardiopsis sediminis]|uniref:Uncharacterized protein n=1 Tax=Nocardiopsis sediminis TaxID=1778267 RepID=A0ABV8FG12_9ACTN